MVAVKNQTEVGINTAQIPSSSDVRENRNGKWGTIPGTILGTGLLGTLVLGGCASIPARPTIPPAGEKTPTPQGSVDIKLGNNKEVNPHKAHIVTSTEPFLLDSNKLPNVQEGAPYIRGLSFALASKIESEQPNRPHEAYYLHLTRQNPDGTINDIEAVISKVGDGPVAGTETYYVAYKSGTEAVLAPAVLNTAEGISTENGVATATTLRFLKPDGSPGQLLVGFVINSDGTTDIKITDPNNPDAQIVLTTKQPTNSLAQLIRSFFLTTVSAEEGPPIPVATPTPKIVPTLTPKPEATPTPLPIATATPMPVAGEPQLNLDGITYNVTTEKGEKLTVPAIAGLKQEVQIINNQPTVIYRAEKGNPYGLKEGAFAGIFYKEFYNKSPGKIEQTGAVSLRTEITNQLLSEAGFPESIVFPLPYDITLGGNLGQAAELQFVKTTEGYNYIFLRLPDGSSVINCLQQSMFVHYAPQPQNGTLLIVFAPNGGIFNKGTTIATTIPEQKSVSVTDQTVGLGQIIPTTITGLFANPYVDRIAMNFQAPIIKPINAAITVRTNAAPIITVNLSSDNILSLTTNQQRLPVFSISNTNPLLDL